MNRNLGFFTSYGIEYVFDYLGEDRIKQRIQELKEKPTGAMGIGLEDFTYRDSEGCYFSGKGVLWMFDLLLQWFSDKEFAQFLYEKSKIYNETNYHDGGLLKTNWEKHVETLNLFLNSNPEHKVYVEVNKINPYWKEYHFFYGQLSKIFMNEELISDYIKHFNEISLRIEQDNLPYSNRLLSNGIVWDICGYYEKKDNHQKAIEIAKLNNTYLDVWREIPEEEEDDEDEE